MSKHRIIFYPVGNGDTSQIILANGNRLLFDFRHQNQGEKSDSPYIDLKKRLKEELDEVGRDYLMWSHLRTGTRIILLIALSFLNYRMQKNIKEKDGSKSTNFGCQQR